MYLEGKLSAEIFHMGFSTDFNGRVIQFMQISDSGVKTEMAKVVSETLL